MATAWQEILSPDESRSAWLTVMGKSVLEISQDLGWAPDNLRHLHRRPAWQAARDHFAAEREAANEAQTREAVPYAVEKLLALLESDDKTAIRAASEILKHAGRYIPQRIKTEVIGTDGKDSTKEEAKTAAAAFLQRLGLPQSTQGK